MTRFAMVLAFECRLTGRELRGTRCFTRLWSSINVPSFNSANKAQDHKKKKNTSHFAVSRGREILAILRLYETFYSAEYYHVKLRARFYGSRIFPVNDLKVTIASKF